MNVEPVSTRPPVARDAHGHFLPGHSGNPNGAPNYGPKIKPVLARLLDMTPAEVAAFVPRTEAERLALLRLHEAGNVKAFRAGLHDFNAVADRVDGPVSQAVVNVGVQVVIRDYG